MLVELHQRVEFVALETAEPYLRGTYRHLEETDVGEDTPLIFETIAYLEQYADALGEANQQVMANVRGKTSAGDLSDYVAGLLTLPFDVELELLTTLDGVRRLTIILDHLKLSLKSQRPNR
jgi:ATP-dependent Lon protease